MKSDLESRVIAHYSLVLQWHCWSIIGGYLDKSSFLDGHVHDISLTSLVLGPECGGRASKIMMCIYNYAAHFPLVNGMVTEAEMETAAIRTCSLSEVSENPVFYIICLRLYLKTKACLKTKV